MSEERKKGYAWRADFGSGVKDLYLQARAVHIDGETQIATDDPSPAQITRAEDIIQRQDAQGRWVGDKLYIRDFVRNVNALCVYLERVKSD